MKGKHSGNLVLHDPVGEKWDRKKKNGKHPTFTVPSPVQPPLWLVFDILLFSYQNEIKKATDNRLIIIELPDEMTSFGQGQSDTASHTP